VVFEEAVARREDAIALVSGQDQVSYGVLNRRANRIAHYLRAKGVKDEELVGICVERGAGMVEAILGVLKAGAAYVPLDRDYPRQRLEYMVEDSAARFVVVQGDRPANLTPSAGLIDLAAERHALECQRDDNPFNFVLPDNLAYVIYTSGSTGLPKGVAIKHSSAVELINWMKESFGPDEMSGVLASTSICFDLSVFEILGTLCCGGKVIVVGNALELMVEENAHGVTLTNTVPSAMEELVEAGAIPQTVITVNLAGESLSRALADKTYDSSHIARLYNLYGPTEDTTYSTTALVRKTGEADRGSIAIGRPLANKRVYILNERLHPLPIGVAGSLFIGGAGLARGYLNRPEMTAEKFIPDPFGAEPGCRLYVTGDLARYDEGGEIEFLGRLDHQVKIRGFRIEVGEIECALGEHPSVSTAVVLAREDVPGNKFLAAYIVPKAGSGPSIDELREFLKERVPDYMLPSGWLFLEKLPLTPNGKLDRRALPAPDRTSQQATVYIPPRTPTEEVIAEIWAAVLGVERVGVQDDFFDLGGHSLLVSQVLSRVRAIFDLEIPLGELVDSPTVEALAMTIDASLREEQSFEARPA
jgi:amino acid adenylation domain-containing protein